MSAAPTAHSAAHSNDPRLAALRTWLTSQLDQGLRSLEPASADASFRRYFRATLADGSTRIVMDAPPDQEDCTPWLRIQALFGGAGVHVPTVYAQDLQQGFLLLSDLGNTTFLQAITADNAAQLYSEAADALIRIQASSLPGVLPTYDGERLMNELRLFPDWYIGQHRKATLSEAQQKQLQTMFEQIVAVNLAEPQVYVHRDYHSRNLMLTPNNNPGIIDFQDAVYGPVSYDLVSLFKDAYIDWDEAQVLDWLIRYWEKARKAGVPVRSDFSEFYRDYEWMGVQRHLKVLGIFARLYHRDGKEGYLKDMPRVALYLHRACERYRELRPLAALLQDLEGREVSAGYTF